MKKIVVPFALSVLSAVLAACGGEENVIHENPNSGGQGSSYSSCNVERDECLTFALEYPVAGLSFTCSGDNLRSFVTRQQGNAVIGACELGDTVNFYVQGPNTANRVELGEVALDSIAKFKNKQTIPQISFLDMAAGALKQPANSLSLTDATTRLASRYVQLFQAIGVKNGQSALGDIQLISLSEQQRDELLKLADSISIQDWQSNQYVALLSPWVELNGLTEQEGLDALVKLNHINNGALYSADLIQLFLAAEGFHGESQLNSQRKNINLFYMLTNRKGEAFGYGIQWVGIPTVTTSETGNSSSTGADVSRLNLLTKENPQLMLIQPVTSWLDPLKKNIVANRPLIFKLAGNNNELRITQGQLINDVGIAGSDNLYKLMSRTETVVAAHLGKWQQSLNGEPFTGTVDIYKTAQMTYLDRRVFKTEANTRVGDKYVFPLYATLTFNFDDRDTAQHKLGIVIDEHGDIRTDIRENATATDLSGQCGTVDNTLMDNFGVQQYNIGTTGTANINTQDADTSLSVRMIIAGDQYHALNGTVIGLNTARDDAATVSVSGAKINLHNLITTGSLINGINITDFDNKAVNWANIYNVYKNVFVNGKDNVSTPEEKRQAERLQGRLAIDIAPCYELKTKS